MASEIASSTPVELPDGRKVRVLSYKDGSLRFRVTDTNSKGYALTEAFLSGSATPVIIKLTPQK